MARIPRKPNVKKAAGRVDDADRAVGIEPDRPYEEDEGSGNRGTRFALDRGFASIDEARRREQRGEKGD